MKVVLASKNQHKLIELRQILSSLGIEVVLESEVGVDIEVEETGTTFEENSLLKAEAVMQATKLPTIADDSGLMVDALCGAPGVYSARYGGMKTDEDRISLLLKNLKNTPDEKRTAQFVCVITCLWPDGRKIVAKGVVPGMITHERRGSGGFGDDPVFYLPERGKSSAELSGEEKNAISHRGKALREFCRLYKEGNYDNK